ncbi:SDR family oxidoreductase [Rhodococcus sp. NPDC060086]|uniref:SDR family oxidoreductase n=1 Tax=Rhodococcus sp. NPDC060086 TaxID=3347055 RepID=UPI003663CC2F
MDTTQKTTATAQIIAGTPLAGRIAVVTGASSGIGAATAQRFAELGASVALIARRGDRIDALEDLIRANGGTALALPTDITDRHAVLATAKRIANELGTVDLLFANAGVQLISGIGDLAVADWDAQIDLNIKGTMNTIAAFVGPLEAAAASGAPADLIVTSSTAAVRYLEGFQVYSATKAYLTQLTRLLRMELGRKKIRVCAIEPGMVDTELPDHVTDPSASKLMADLIEQIDVLQSEDIAEAVAFIASVPKHVNLTEIHILPTEQAI